MGKSAEKYQKMFEIYNNGCNLRINCDILSSIAHDSEETELG